MHFKIEWLDWDYKTHFTTYAPNKIIKDWNDKTQIPLKQRGKVRQILQREKL